MQFLPDDVAKVQKVDESASVSGRASFVVAFPDLLTPDIPRPALMTLMVERRNIVWSLAIPD
jgi:hypothetical protein